MFHYALFPIFLAFLKFCTIQRLFYFLHFLQIKRWQFVAKHVKVLTGNVSFFWVVTTITRYDIETRLVPKTNSCQLFRSKLTVRCCQVCWCSSRSTWSLLVQSQRMPWFYVSSWLVEKRDVIVLPRLVSKGEDRREIPLSIWQICWDRPKRNNIILLILD